MSDDDYSDCTSNSSELPPVFFVFEKFYLVVWHSYCQSGAVEAHI